MQESHNPSLSTTTLFTSESKSNNTISLLGAILLVTVVLALPGSGLFNDQIKLVALLASFLTFATTYVVCEKRLTQTTGFTASIMLLGSIGWHSASLHSPIGSIYSSLLFLSLLSLYLWEERKLSGLPYGAIVCLSLITVLTGMSGIILCAGCYLLYLGLLRYPTSELTRAMGLSLVPTIVLAGATYLLRETLTLPPLIDKFSTEIFGTTNVLVLGDFYAAFITGFLPWVVLLLIGVPQIIPGIKIGMRKLGCATGTLPLATKLHIFSFVIIVAFLGYFSLLHSRSSIHLLPIYPFLSIAVAPFIIYLVNEHPNSVRLLCTLFGMISLCLALYSIVSQPTGLKPLLLLALPALLSLIVLIDSARKKSVGEIATLSAASYLSWLVIYDLKLLTF